MDIAKSLKGNFLFLMSKAVDSKVNGKEITKGWDKKLDKQIGEKHSEKIQRGPAWGLLKEMSEGLFDEDIGALIIEIDNWGKELREVNQKGR